MKTKTSLIIEPLIQPNPSSEAKLVAVWDGLSTETRIEVILRLAGSEKPISLSPRILEKALGDQNPYVRYLACRGLYLSDEKPQEQALKARIEADQNPLVRYALLESTSALFDAHFKNPDKFFALPHEARLAKVRLLSGDGQQIAAVISHGVEHQLKNGSVSERELFEILTDYLVKPSFKKHYGEKLSGPPYDGFGEFEKGNDIKALWHLIPKSPPKIRYLLLEHLPEEAGFMSGIPKDALDAMTDRELQELLQRKDIVLRYVRKKLFNQGKLREYAVLYNFDMTNEEFTSVMAITENNERHEALKSLVWAADLRLCIYDVVKDVLTNNYPTDNDDAEYAVQSLMRRLSAISGLKRKEELLELRLYRLAKYVVPFQGEVNLDQLSSDLSFLKDKVVSNRTWDTFVGFEEAW